MLHSGLGRKLGVCIQYSIISITAVINNTSTLSYCDFGCIKSIKRTVKALQNFGKKKSRKSQQAKSLERAKKKHEADRLKALAALDDAEAGEVSSGSDEEAAAGDRIGGESDELDLSCNAEEDGE